MALGNEVAVKNDPEDEVVGILSFGSRAGLLVVDDHWATADVNSADQGLRSSFARGFPSRSGDRLCGIYTGHERIFPSATQARLISY